jgi:hypothetical protein
LRTASNQKLQNVLKGLSPSRGQAVDARRVGGFAGALPDDASRYASQLRKAL